jgi:hypothetical protein
VEISGFDRFISRQHFTTEKIQEAHILHDSLIGLLLCLHEDGLSLFWGKLIHFEVCTILGKLQRVRECAIILHTIHTIAIGNASDRIIIVLIRKTFFFLSTM